MGFGTEEGHKGAEGCTALLYQVYWQVERQGI